MFKKEVAASMKLEFPNMKSQERQMIVKDRWRSLHEDDKVIFVVKARVEEIRLQYESIQLFHKSRIDYARELISDKYPRE
jgi:hypothetical protein